MNKFYICEECGIVSKINVCSECLNKSIEIRVTYEGGSANIGGSLIQGLCECGELVARKGFDDQGRARYRSKCRPCSKKVSKLS